MNISKNKDLFQKQMWSSVLIGLILLSSVIVVGILVTYDLLFGLGAILLLLVGFIFFTNPNSVTLGVFFILYTNAAVIAVRFHGVPFIIGASVGMFLLVPIIFGLLFHRQKLVFDKVLLPLLGFLLVQFLGTLFSRDPSESLNHLITFATEGIILYFLVVNATRSKKLIRQAIWVLLIAGAFLGGLSLFQQISGTFDNDYFGFAQVGGRGFDTGERQLQGDVEQARLEGPLGEKNYYAQILLVLVPLGLYQLLNEESRTLQILIGLFTFFVLAGIILTFSRGVAIAFVLMLFTMFLMRAIKFHQLIFILVGVFLLFQLFPQYGVRLGSLQSLVGIAEQDSAGITGTDISTQGRIGEMGAAWLVFLDHPILGVGPGMFNSYYPEYAERIGLRIHTGTREAHNLFLGIAADYGLVGTVLFLAIVAISLRNLAKVRKKTMENQPDISNMATGLLLGIISYLATGLFLSLAYERYFWLILGLSSALYWVANNQESLVAQESIQNREAHL